MFEVPGVRGIAVGNAEPELLRWVNRGGLTFKREMRGWGDGRLEVLRSYFEPEFNVTN